MLPFVGSRSLVAAGFEKGRGKMNETNTWAWRHAEKSEKSHIEAQHKPNFDAIYEAGNRLVAYVTGTDKGERDYRVRIISEAGTVASETQLTPLQMSNQRTKLLEALENLERALGGEIIYPEADSMEKTIQMARDNARAAITEARRK
jgi:hypothetical protein